MLPTFPISALLPTVQKSVHDNDELLLIAPPGAGKTTLVPLALLAQLSATDGKIIVIEPRRIAARSAAARMAELLAEPVGKRVGYRVRLETCVSEATKIEVVTEGVFLRMLQHDPSLESVSVVIFDEFHERSLNSDLALALTINSIQLFSDLREHNLKLIVMSATLDSEGLSVALSNYLTKTVPVLESPGKSFPVDVVYSEKNFTRYDIIPAVYSFVVDALVKTNGNVLVFLPGIGEINRVNRQLHDKGLAHYFGPNSVDVFLLHGGLSLAAQTAIVNPKKDSKSLTTRRVILTTSIAQTSLTIPGVTAVVDSGLVRLPEFDAKTTTTRLVTTSISKATAKQRAGRAGRLGPGVCFKMWREEKDYQLPDFDTPEILSSDLTDFLLQLKSWGVDDLQQLFWLNTPPKHLLGAGLTLLNDLEAIAGNTLTLLGERMASLPVSSRIAKMLLVASVIGSERLACDIAALTQEYKHKDTANVNLLSIIYRVFSAPAHKNTSREFTSVSALSKQLLQLTKKLNVDNITLPFVRDEITQYFINNQSGSDDELIGFLLAQAFPDRIAKRVGANRYKLANGRGAMLDESDPLTTNEWLLVMDVGGQKNQSRDRIYSAIALSKNLLENQLSYLIKSDTQIRWNESDGRFIAARISKIGHIVLNEINIETISEALKTQSLMEWIKNKGEVSLDRFTWDDDVLQWRARVTLMGEIDSQSNWPDVTNRGLLASLDEWLAPFVSKITNLAQLKQLSIFPQLSSLIDWQQQQQLEQWLPGKLPVPSGSKITINYCENPPVLAVKLQEMFGLDQSPSLAQGKVALSIHLLSPARRPLQITQDLAGFWAGSYQEVRKEMKGRYPKHHWPEDPYSVAPTAKAKPRKSR